MPCSELLSFALPQLVCALLNLQWLCESRPPQTQLSTLPTSSVLGSSPAEGTVCLFFLFLDSYMSLGTGWVTRDRTIALIFQDLPSPSHLQPPLSSATALRSPPRTGMCRQSPPPGDDAHACRLSPSSKCCVRERVCDCAFP